MAFMACIAGAGAAAAFLAIVIAFMLLGLDQTLVKIAIGLLESHKSRPHGLVEAVGLLGLVSDILVLGGLLNPVLLGLLLIGGLCSLLS